MQLYHSFKEKISDEGTEEQKTKLLDIMLLVVNEKPSLITSKYEAGGIWHALISLVAKKNPSNTT